ncbi:MAG: hypothetical protein RI897_1278 [Verrucomicrobiota bacterium]|jgi:glycosyltransferase involved in cell wall biosynthesis
MRPKRQKLLFIHHTSVVGGASWSLYQIIAALRSDYEIVVALAKAGPLQTRLEQELGVRVILDKRIRGFTTAFGGNQSLLSRANLKGLTGWFNSITAAREICARERPDIVHLNTFVLFHTAIGCKEAGVPRVVMHVREPLLFKPGGWREQLMQRTTRNHIDAVMAISRANALEVGLPERTTLVHNWPDFTGRNGSVDFEKDFRLRPDQRLILALGERHRHKGSLTAALAMEDVRDPKAVLIILGGHPQGGTLKRTVRNTLNALHIPTYGLQIDWAAAANPNKVQLAPVNLNVQPLIERAEFILCPFIRPHFAKATIEAGALGKTSIVSAGSPQDESVVPGHTGLIVPPGDQKALAAAINHLLENPKLTRQLGKQARDFVSEHYNREKSLALIRHVYQG